MRYGRVQVGQVMVAYLWEGTDTLECHQDVHDVPLHERRAHRYWIQCWNRKGTHLHTSATSYTFIQVHSFRFHLSSDPDLGPEQPVEEEREVCVTLDSNQHEGRHALPH